MHNSCSTKHGHFNIWSRWLTWTMILKAVQHGRFVATVQCTIRWQSRWVRVVLMRKEIVRITFPRLTWNEKAWKQGTVTPQWANHFAFFCWSFKRLVFNQRELVLVYRVLNCLLLIWTSLLQKTHITLCQLNDLSWHSQHSNSWIHHTSWVQFQYVLTIIQKWIAILHDGNSQAANFFSKFDLHCLALLMMFTGLFNRTCYVIGSLKFLCYSSNFRATGHPPCQSFLVLCNANNASITFYNSIVLLMSLVIRDGWVVSGWLSDYKISTLES